MALTMAEQALLDLHCSPNASDEDVVVASYRQSRFLFFVISVYEHLNDTNVAILAKKTPFTSFDLEDGVRPTLVDVSSASSLDTEMDNYDSGEIVDTPEATPDGEDRSLMSPSDDPEASIMSSTDDVATCSDFEEDVDGTYFDDTTWRCEACCHELVDGQCPNGDDLPVCTSCHRVLLGGCCPNCDVKCENCDVDKTNGVCPECRVEGDSEEEDFIAYDPKDGVWRCIDCQWEVEADNDTDGNCHCLTSKGQAHYLDISECFDYQPADSCSSVDESSEEESDSEDERFIDDDDVGTDLMLCPGMGVVEHAGMSLTDSTTGHISAAVQRPEKVKVEEEKENQPPGITSDDTQVINAPTARKSNIIDCESMEI